LSRAGLVKWLKTSAVDRIEKRRESHIMTSADTASQLNRSLPEKPGPACTSGGLLLFLMGVLVCPPATAGTEIEIDKALVTIESNERRAQSLQCAVECREGKVKDPLRPETANLGPVNRRGHVKVDLASPPEVFQQIFPPWASVTKSRKPLPE
jgi:hypothetical protein